MPFINPAPDLDFRELGLFDAERLARMRLQERLAEIVDVASREDLARPGSHVIFFKAFTEYTAALLERYATVLSSEQAPDVFRNRLVGFASWLVAAIIAPHPHTPRPDEEGSPVSSDDSISDVLNREDHYLEELHRCTQHPLDWPDQENDDPLLYSHLVEPECLWEASLTRVFDLASIKNKLPRLYLSKFVYLLRRVVEWEELNVEICTRVVPRAWELIEGHNASPATSGVAKAKPQMDRSALLPKLHSFAELKIRVISDSALQASWPDGTQTWNFIELGFEDGRSKGKPTHAWRFLLQLADRGGMVAVPFATRKTLEKHAQALRKRFRELFGAEDEDPLSYDKGKRAYVANFSISSVDRSSL